jgi:hypothetical protein
VADFLRVAIEGTTGAQRLGFLRVGRHGGRCKSNFTLNYTN